MFDKFVLFPNNEVDEKLFETTASESNLFGQANSYFNSKNCSSELRVEKDVHQKCIVYIFQRCVCSFCSVVVFVALFSLFSIGD